MRVFIVAMAIVLLTVPAFSQSGGLNSAAGAGRGGSRPEEPKVDPEKKKAEEKAFKDALGRIPTPDKKYDPWGTVRQSSK